MLFDDENEILTYVRDSIICGSVLHFNGSQFNRKVQRCLLDASGLISDNSHASVPPDFYSDRYDMMFDVLRINDSEIKKSYNPVKMRERKLYNEVRENFGDSDVIVSSESCVIGEHSYKKYVRNAKRVIAEHIKKISLWEQKCPSIKHKGLLVFDETELYYEGFSVSSGYVEPDRAWRRYVDMNGEFHRPWLDKYFIQAIYESELDFVIWFCPYKPYGVARQVGVEFPDIVFIDTRYSFDKYATYSDNLVC